MRTLYSHLDELISHDIAFIYEQQGFQDGMYGSGHHCADGLHRGDGVIERVLRTEVKGFENFPLRIYVLSSYNNGGICIIGKSNDYSKKLHYFIINLGEDDGYYFTGYRDYEKVPSIETSDKEDLIYLTSHAISLLNNIKE